MQTQNQDVRCYADEFLNHYTRLALYFEDKDGKFKLDDDAIDANPHLVTEFIYGLLVPDIFDALCHWLEKTKNPRFSEAVSMATDIEEKYYDDIPDFSDCDYDDIPDYSDRE